MSAIAHVGKPVNGSSFGLLGSAEAVVRMPLTCFASSFSSSGLVGGVEEPEAGGGVEVVGGVEAGGVDAVGGVEPPLVVVEVVVGVLVVVGVVVDELVVVVVVGGGGEAWSQWSSFPRALPWSSQSFPFSLGSGRQF